MPADDILRRFLAMARELHPETPPFEWLRLEVDLRREFGGRRCYIRKSETIARGREVVRSR
jgi:hypothetical protein